jgi:DNA repair exonuclease SbcCD ATPase subunit
VLSGGEKNRVGLARLLSGSANLLVLDEPTNHLDMPSVEVLSQALGQFSGTALFVSHNRDFIESVCTHVLAVTRCGRAGFFIGGLDDYQRSCQRMGFPDVLGSDVSSSTVGTPGKDQSAPLVQPSPARRGEAALLRKELTRVESRLAALELEKRDVEAKLAACSHGEYQRAQALGADLTRVTSEQSVCEEKWLELQERLETMDR